METGLWLVGRTEGEFGPIVGGDTECWLGGWVTGWLVEEGAQWVAHLYRRKKKKKSHPSWLAECSDIPLVCRDKRTSHLDVRAFIHFPVISQFFLWASGLTPQASSVFFSLGKDTAERTARALPDIYVEQSIHNPNGVMAGYFWSRDHCP